MPRKRKYSLDIEDELFLGIVFGLLLFFVTVPSLSDLSSFLEEFTSMPQHTCISASITIKIVIIISFSLSVVFRYYGAVTKSGLHRYLSLELLLIGFLFSVSQLVLAFSFGLMIMYRSVFFVALGHIVMIPIALGVGVAEEGIIRFYIRIGQMKFYPPFVHSIALVTNLLVLTTFIYALSPHLFDLGWGSFRFLLMIFRVFLVGLFLYVFTRRWRQKKFMFWR